MAYHEDKNRREWENILLFVCLTFTLENEQNKTTHLLTCLDWISKPGGSLESPIQPKLHKL